MNILIDLLPSSVEVECVKYEINSDFRTSILFEMLMQDDEVSDEDKIVASLELYYAVLPPNLEMALEKILGFYRCSKDIVKSKGNDKCKSVTQIYSFDYDDDYIYAAFLDQYGVDLQDIEYLHWWKFKAMFKSLKEDAEIVKIMGYRAMDVSKIKDKEEKEFYNRMKKMYEIPRGKNELEKINAIEDALINGRDINNIL
ncbi:bacteriophage Gp15 family protein [Clostridium gasigenes]|uniref:bacteriophage Gp15 family protein n=1 Tax=Clostridium gasigenes TaxID=94869 RepID=UPI001C0B888C|nr:bacteriophage Gp15 family protein [Clostridium gasigenes]MBU3109340.1 bacteriophage Gp15 family protein [Clostridium gasigenes]